jgi:hypothetical protein
MNRPTVSVIIPHFNRAALLQVAVESVLQSSRQDFEVIIVDDASDPSEAARAHSLVSDKVRVLDRRDGLKGPSRCRNIGIAASVADYIIFLDSDDVMGSWCLDERLRKVEEQGNIDLWIFPVMLFNQYPGDTDRLWNKMETGVDDGIRFAVSDPPWHTSSVLWKKTALIRIGCFNEKVFYGDDTDLHLRAIASGLVTRKFPDCVPDIFVRRSDTPRITNSLTSDLVASRRARLREASAFLKALPERRDLLSAFEGQYFVEGEFLLFNHHDPAESVEPILSDWQSTFHPQANVRRLVRTYFYIALRDQSRSRISLRIARRLAMQMLPPTFFPRGGEFESASASQSTFREVRHRMQRRRTNK